MSYNEFLGKIKGCQSCGRLKLKDYLRLNGDISLWDSCKISRFGGAWYG